MKKILALLTVSALLIAGCAWKKNTVVSGSAATGFTTNVFYSVNTNNLILQKVAVTTATMTAVTVTLNATHDDPRIVQALKNAQITIGGILNGTSQQTTAQVIQLLKAQNNPALSAQIDDLLTVISNAEQQMLQNFGAGVAGQITLGLTQAVYSGLTISLATH